MEFRDTDADVAPAAGRTVADLFVDQGEAAFRRLEREAVAVAVAEHAGVLSLGGGAILDARGRRSPANPGSCSSTCRWRMRATGSGSTATGRCCSATRAASWMRCWTRRPLYERGRRPEVDRRPYAEDVVAEEARSCAGRTGSSVTPTRGSSTVGGRAAHPPPYDVVVGHGLLGELPALVQHGAPVSQSSTRGAAGHSPTASRDLARPGSDAHWPRGARRRGAKDGDGRGACWDALGAAGFTRTDAVVGVGGGSDDRPGRVRRGDLAARGARSSSVPTTLLGMVDAAVGGKTGINTEAGKNLVGAFHPPAGVLCDLDLLETLPSDDYRAGLAEVVKCGFIADPVILDLVEADPVGARSPAGPHTRELVERAIAVKARVVSSDPREAGLREILNYGHTLGHAIEKVEDYRWRHGAAVSVGMVFAAELARLAGRLDDATADRHRGCCTRSACRPPTRPTAGRPARGDAGRQEDPRRPAALRRPRRPRRAADSGRPRPEPARRCLREGDVMTRVSSSSTVPTSGGSAPGSPRSTADDLRRARRALRGTAAGSASRSTCARPTTRRDDRLAARGRRRGAPRRAQPRRVDPLLVRAARRLLPAACAAHRGAPVQSGRARGSGPPPSAGGRAPGPRPLRRLLLRARAAGPGPRPDPLGAPPPPAPPAAAPAAAAPPPPRSGRRPRPASSSPPRPLPTALPGGTGGFWWGGTTCSSRRTAATPTRRPPRSPTPTGGARSRQVQTCWPSPRAAAAAGWRTRRTT